MFTPILISALSLIAIIKLSDIFISNIARLGQSTKMSKFMLGSTISAIGTSLPEAVFTISSKLKNIDDVALSNIIGSNIFNILFTLGFCNILCKINLNQKYIQKNIIILILTNLIFWLFCLNGSINRFHGFFFLIIQIALLYNTNKHKDNHTVIVKNQPATKQETNIPKTILKATSSIIAIIGCSQIAIHYIHNIITVHNLNGSWIGLIFISAGTALPELATSLTASIKKEYDILIGSVIGSCLFNITGIIGVTAIISPISCKGSNINLEMSFLLLSSVLLFVISKTPLKLHKIYGHLMIGLFSLFITISSILYLPSLNQNKLKNYSIIFSSCFIGFLAIIHSTKMTKKYLFKDEK